MPIEYGKIRPHVSETVRTVVSKLPEMRRRTFDYGITPADSGPKGLGRRLSEWGPVVEAILQLLAVSRGYPKPSRPAAARATHSITLTKGITELAKKISELT